MPGLTTPSATPLATTDPETSDMQAPAQPGVLSVTSEPSGLLFVDGRLIGRTPITGARVQPGTRSVRIIQPGFVTFEQTITVEPGATASLGTITLQARPPPNPNQ